MARLSRVGILMGGLLFRFRHSVVTVIRPRHPCDEWIQDTSKRNHVVRP